MNHNFSVKFKLRRTSSDTPILPISNFDSLDSDDEEYLYLNTNPKNIFIVGDACSGKSSLCKRIASHWNLLCIDVQELVLQQIHLGPSSKYNTSIQQSLTKSIFSSELYHSILTDTLKSTNIKNQGYIVSYDPCWDITIWNLICNFLNTNKPSYIFSLNLSQEEAVERMELRKQQLQSRIEELKNELASIDSFLTSKPTGPINEEENEQSNQESEEEIMERTKKMEESKQRRQVILIELAFANTHGKKISPTNQTPNELLSLLNVKKYFNIDALQTDDEIYFHAIQLLRKYRFRSSALTPDIPSEIMSEADILSKFQEMYSPKQSIWGKYCPVTYVEQNILCEGSFQFCVIYRGKLYYTASAEYQFKLLKYPNKFLRQKPEFLESVLVFLDKSKADHITLFQLLLQKCVVKPTLLQKFLSSTVAPKKDASNSKQDVKSGVMIDIDSEQSEIYIGAIHKRRCTIVDCSTYSPKNLEDLIAKTIPNMKIVFLESSSQEEIKEGEGIATTDAYTLFLNEFIPKLEQSGKVYLKFKIEKNILYSVNNLMQQIDPFKYNCVEAVTIPKNENNEVDENWDRIGKTKLYCPVSLKRKKLLVKGNTDIAIEYKNRVYFFNSEDDREEFKKCPEFYCQNIEPTRPIVSVVGINSFKNEILELIAQKYNIPILKFEKKYLLDFAATNCIQEALNKAEKLASTPIVEEGSDDAAKQESDLLNQLFSIIIQSTVCQHGVLLNNLPTSASEFELLSSLNVFPDVVLYSQISVDEYAAIHSPAEILIEETKQNMFKKAQYEREKSEKISKKLKKPWIEEEKPPEADPPVFLSKDEVIEKVRTFHATFTEALDSILEKFTERKIPVVKLQHSAKRINAAVIESLCINLFSERSNLFVCRYVLSHEAAIEKLRSASKYLHPTILYEDPVQRSISSLPIEYPNIFTIQQTITEREIIARDGSEEQEEEQQTEEEEGESSPKQFEIIKNPPEISYPVVFGHWIIFFQSEQNRRTFLSRPSLFLNVVNNEEYVNIKLCVLGQQEKTTMLSDFFSSQFNLEIISVYSIVEHFLKLESKKQTKLYFKCKEVLEQFFNSTLVAQNIQIPPESVPFLQELTQYRIRSFKSSVFGYVLTNIPFSEEHAKCFEEIDCVALLNTSHSVIYNYFQKTFLNGLDATSQSSNQLWKLQLDMNKAIVERKMKKIELSKLLDIGKPVCIANTGLSDWFIKQRITTQFLTYCPVSFVTENILIDCKENEQFRQNMVLYNDGIFYFASTETMNMFLEKPDEYLDQNLYKIPDLLPKYRISVQRQKEEAEEDENYEDEQFINQTYALKGFCPVMLSTLKNKQPIFEWGKSCYSVDYDEKKFRMSNFDCFVKFIRQPWRYANVTLPERVPKRRREHNSLEVISYLEEVAQQLLNVMLMQVHNLRPVYPFLTVKQSALVFCALFLRSENPYKKQNVARLKRAKHELEVFQDRCISLRSYFCLHPFRTESNASQYEEKAKIWDQIKNKQVSIPGQYFY